MIRRLFGILIVVAILGIALNDVSRVATAMSGLRTDTYELTRWAAENTDGLTRDQGAALVLAEAQRFGITLYAYDQTEKAVRVYTSVDVTGTVVAGPIYNMLSGAEFREALKSPLTVRDHRDAAYAR